MSRKIQYVIKRFFDIFFSLLAVVVLSPVMLLSMIGIKISDPGPVIYKAKRVGKNGTVFNVYKFRSMYVNSNRLGSITAVHDARIFPFGNVLRRLKIDELPQLFNIIGGSMSIIGPRPEAADIVGDNYADWMKETLTVLPGLASPGSLFDYTHGAEYLGGEDVDRTYIENLLPLTVAMELYYVRNFSLWYDTKLIARTVATIIAQMFGRKHFKYTKEYEFAKQYVESLKAVS